MSKKLICRLLHHGAFIEFTARSFIDQVSGKRVRVGTCSKCGINYSTDGGIFAMRSYNDQ